MIRELTQNSKKIEITKIPTKVYAGSSWVENKNLETNLLSYEAKQQNEKLEKLFANTRNKDGWKLCWIRRSDN